MNYKELNKFIHGNKEIREDILQAYINKGFISFDSLLQFITVSDYNTDYIIGQLINMFDYGDRLIIDSSFSRTDSLRLFAMGDIMRLLPKLDKTSINGWLYILSNDEVNDTIIYVYNNYSVRDRLKWFKRLNLYRINIYHNTKNIKWYDRLLLSILYMKWRS